MGAYIKQSSNKRARPKTYRQMPICEHPYMENNGSMVNPWDNKQCLTKRCLKCGYIKYKKF